MKSAGVCAILTCLGASVHAAVISANADAFQTTPGSASVALNFGAGPVAIPLEGATEFSSPKIPLTGAEVSRLNTLAPNVVWSPTNCSGSIRTAVWWVPRPRMRWVRF